jgi:hypothetical protein
MAEPSRTRTALLAVALAAVSAAGCDSVPADAIEECSAGQVIPGAVATDILFVIDNSGSMSEEQSTLRAGLDAFIQELAASPIANDFQIGVTTTAVVDFGAADDGVSGGALVAPGIMRATDTTLVSDFQSAVLVGTTGYGREQPFTAARRAIERSVPGGANDGFLRPGAKLAVIFLSDEDDCSGAEPLASDSACQAERTASPSKLVPIAEVVSALSGGGARELVAAAIVGVAPDSLDLVCVTNPVCGGGPSVSCPTCCSTALYPGHRFVELLGAVGQATTRLASICDPSFDQALRDFATVILSQTLPLDGAPADWRMLVAHVERPGLSSTPCRIAPADADAATRNAADAVYEPPLGGRPASLTFQNACALEQGDRVVVDVVCAG